MPKIWVASDTHYDFGGLRLEPPAEADIAIVAGDAQDDDWLARLAIMLPTIYVAGNHDYYGWDFQERLASLSAVPGLHFLNDRLVEIEDVRIAGSTLWTDYGRDPIAAEMARRGMNDHRYIKWTKNPYQRFLPSHATRLHEASKAFLSSVKADVIVTHHAPSGRSVAPQYEGSVLNRAYYSDLDDIVEASGAAYWIHGHTHTPFDYTIGETRVICNPKGYPHEARNGFNPALTVEI